MKLNIIRLLSIVCLVLVGNVSYAGNTAAAADGGDDSKVSVNKLKSDATGRSVGNALAKANKHTETTNTTAPDKKRIQELEEIVSEQQKLIEMYKKQSN